MKGIVAYDSVNGNTKQVAEAIAAEIKAQGHEAELMFIKDEGQPPADGDFLFIGSPTRVSKMTKPTGEFIDGLDPAYWGGRPIIAFDTIGPLSKDVEKRKSWLEKVDAGNKNAACRIRDACGGRGLNVHPKMLHLAVTGMWGPLAPEALDTARAYTREFLRNVK
jgi:flavodoxin